MKTIKFTLILICISLTSFGQVGIGNTNPKASLDISASNSAMPSNTDGILIPKIDNFPTTNPGTDQNGMLVFVTGNGTPTKGFYYWDNDISNWTPVLSIKKIDDLDDGKSDNDGSEDGSSLFLGIDAGLMDDSTNNRNIGIGFNSLKSNTSGYGNTAIGNTSLPNSTTAFGNTSIGQNTMFFNTIGVGNTAIGHSSLFDNTTGVSNVGLGQATLQNNQTGNYNVAIGSAAGAFDSESNNNVYIGYKSGGGTHPDPFNEVKSGNVFIGYRSGEDESGSNKLIIENSDALDPLIYGEFDNKILRTNGEFQINDPSATGYAFPLTDGTANQVLTTDGAGNISFQNVTGGGSDNWTNVGADIERQTGDVYIGDDATTDNDLYISNRLIDWDNNTYYLDPSTTSRLNRIFMLGNTVATPAIAIGTNNTGFYGFGSNQVGFTSNGTEKLRFTNQGQIEFLNTGSSIFIGDFAGENDDLTNNNNTFIGDYSGTTNTSGANNTALGKESLRQNTTGISNTALGNLSLRNNSTGSFNVAIGVGALRDNTTESNNVSIGSLALANMETGNGNVAIGNRAGLKDQNSERNTYIGDHAGSGLGSAAAENKTDNVFIGYRSGYNESGSNKLYIENTDASTPLIYGEFDNDIARVNGTFQINDPNTTGYAFPITDGTNNQVLTTNGSGAISWASPSSNITANNGLTQVSNNIQLGGTLTKNTAIDFSIFDLDFNLNDSGQFNIKDNSTTLARFLSVSGNYGILELYESGTVSTQIRPIGTSYFRNSNLAIGTPISSSYRLNVHATSNDYVANFKQLGSGFNAKGVAIRLADGSTQTSHRYVSFFRSDDTEAGKISGSTLGTGVQYSTTSDRRLKMNIENIPNALSLLDQIQPQLYEYKAFPGHKEYGFIAQDLQLVYPQAVSGSPDSDPSKNPMMVDYSRLTPILTAGVKELYAEVIKLKNENKILIEKLNRLEQLEARLSTLEAKTNKFLKQN